MLEPLPDGGVRPLLSAAGSTRAWRALRAACLLRDGYVCQIPTAAGQLCGEPATHADHIVPRSRGGADVLENLRAACGPCNMRRGADPGGLVRTWTW